MYRITVYNFSICSQVDDLIAKNRKVVKVMYLFVILYSMLNMINLVLNFTSFDADYKITD